MKKVFKILIVVDSINVNDSSGSKANVALIKNLAECGFPIKVYHYSRKDIQIESIPCYEIPELKRNINYFLSRMQRLIQRHLNVNLAKFLEHIFGFSFTYFNDVNSIKKYLEKSTLNDFDLILTLSKGASFRPHYAMLSFPNHHKRWMAYIHDPYPFHYYPEPYNWPEPGYKKKIDFFKVLSEKAKFSVFPSLLLKDWMGNYFPNFLKTGIVIPHQADNFSVSESKLPVYYNKHNFTLLHLGNLLKQRNPIYLIKAYKKFLEKNPAAIQNSNLLLLGPAKFHEGKIIEEIKDCNQIYFDSSYMEYDKAVLLQKETSVNIILEAIAKSSPFLPGKFPTCVYANKPILLVGPKNSETNRLLGENYQYHAEADDEKRIAYVIQTLYDRWMENNNLNLDRKDLEYYISKDYLKEIFSQLN